MGGANSLGLMWWMLCREVRRLRGITPRAVPWEDEVMPDLFFFRDNDEEEKKKAIKAEEVKGSEAPVVEAVEEGVDAVIVEQPLTAVPKEEVVDMSATTGTTENWGAA